MGALQLAEGQSPLGTSEWPRNCIHICHYLTLNLDGARIDIVIACLSPGGKARLDYFKHVLLPPNVSKTALALQWDSFGSAKLWISVFVLLYLNLQDATGEHARSAV